MDFARKHRLFDEADDLPPIIHVASGRSWAALAESAATGKPLEIVPGLGPPPPEFRTVVIDGVPTLVLMETGCACDCEQCGEHRPLSPPRGWATDWYSYWGVKRRPRRS